MYAALWSSKRRRPSARDGAGGFTLIESLVVLMIVAFAATILTDSLSRIFDLRTRLASYLDAAASSRMTLNWLRRSVSGLLPDFADGTIRFLGTATEFSGISLSGPGADPGVPQRVAWRLRPEATTRGVRLETQVGSGPWVAVAAWPEKTGRLSYDGGDGQWVEEWPPSFATPTTPQIPRYIRIVIGSGADAWSTTLASEGPRESKERTGDIARSVLGL